MDLYTTSQMILIKVTDNINSEIFVKSLLKKKFELFLNTGKKNI